MDNSIKILLVEDVSTDLELILRSIKKSEIAFTYASAVTREEFTSAILSFKPDIILSDYMMPVFDGMEALNLRKKMAPDIPFLLVTGTNNEETAVECMREGADDYILKDNLTRLGQAIKAALRKYEYIRSKKEAEDALFESEELFRASFENAAIAVCMIYPSGIFLNVNNTFCSMVGYPKEELLTMNYDAITYEEDLSICKVNTEELLAARKNNISYDKRYIHKEGAIVWANVSLALIHSPKLHTEYFVAYVENITKRKKAEEELLKAKEKAEESDQLKTAFLQNISHEIRTPMNAIIGFSDFLRDSELSPQKREHFVDVIIQSTTQLLSIITDIITISSIEAGQEKAEETKVHLNTCLKLIYSQYERTAQDKKIALSYIAGLSNKNDLVITDEIKLEGILSNLVGNALKFTREGSVEFGYQVKDGFVEFFIKDTGIGIPSDMHNEVFKRFRQLELTQSRHYGGSGLGLSISKAYVELLKGKIWVDSQPGKGSVFYFTIPFKDVGETISPEQLPEIKPLDRPITALIAEDEESGFQLLKELLNSWHIKVLHAATGMEVIHICEKEPLIDFILMDLNMPEMDGIQTLKIIKELFPQIPVVVQSAYALSELRIQSFQEGCYKFLSKPINKSELYQTISELTGQKPQ